ncbi:MAG: isopenicillin N synthase family dioxygenase [Acidimicrobiales bacterium]
MSGEILDVDLLKFEKGDASTKRAVVDGVMKSLENGFVYTAHDLPSSLLDDAYGKLDEFFGSANDTKGQFVAEGSHGSRGYTGLLVETAAIADVPDFKEMLNWGPDLPGGHPLRVRFPESYRQNLFPDAVVPGISETLTTFHNTLAELQRRFLRIIAVGIGCHESFFDAMVTDGSTLSRAIHYPPMDQAPDEEHIWAGAHGDINLITALPRSTAKGLQVEVDGAWVDAMPPDDHVIINTGIMLEIITNGLVPIGVHRVVADPDDSGDRLSVVQFCHPTPWTVLSPVASCVTPENPQRFGSISAADRLAQVLYEINLIEDARRV